MRTIEQELTSCMALEKVVGITIFYLSIVYALGNITLAASSAILLLNIPHRDVALLGLFLIALGSGGIKPCVSSFGGDQFAVPEQERQLQQFFSIFYFSINVGSMFGTLISPILRQDVHCLGEESCFPLAFALPALLMVSAIVIFVLGKRFYLIRKPGGNILIRMCGCIGYALKKKVTCDSRGQKVNHWLELANDKYDSKLINETRIMLSLALMLSPCIFFWALFEQTGSRWTFQASRMNGEVLGYFNIKPDQLHIINPILVLLIIPFFQKFLYPCLASLHLLRTQLQKMVLGGILTAIAFFMSGILEMYLQPTYAVLPGRGEAQLRIFNSFGCNVHLQGSDEFNASVMVESHDMFELKVTGVFLEKSIDVRVNILKEECPNIDSSSLEWRGAFKLTEERATSYLIHGSLRHLNVTSTGYDNVAKSDNGDPRIRVLYSTPQNDILTLRGCDTKTQHATTKLILNSANVTSEELELPKGCYELSSNEISSEILFLKFGGVYRIMLPNKNVGSGEKWNRILFTINPPSSINMLWMVPQFIVITVAEVLFSVTALEFSFMQAPVTMKSVASSLNLLSTSLGNLVVVFIEKAVHTSNQVHNFFIYGGLMIAVMIIFTILAINYKA
ncbi:hypothetical protein LSTR_LSTR004487 [Laodelphax striatellus]|uniref:Uncharacterized protein n=1 Tax=Laodelphax striatellus TaxID=195883 RepID=A0A482XMY2_LAOST|nr:hypothetical protein LSTR_LSTR004487 [Laodelphax striatellus]